MLLASRLETAHRMMSCLFHSAHKPGTTYKTQTGCPDSTHPRRHHIGAFGMPQCRVPKTPIDEKRDSCWTLLCFDSIGFRSSRLNDEQLLLHKDQLACHQFFQRWCPLFDFTLLVEFSPLVRSQRIEPSPFKLHR